MLSRDYLNWVILTLTILHRVNSLSAATSSCRLTVSDNSKLYDYALDSPLPSHPHGARSEDGFYKVVGNKTVIWFQVRSISFAREWFSIMTHLDVIIACILQWPTESTDNAILPNDLDSCIRIETPKACTFGLAASLRDCGGPSRCGMGCSALVAKNKGGYNVCTTVGRAASMDINIIDKKNPHMGVVVKMSSNGLNGNCSISVSVMCDPNAVEGPSLLEKTGKCDYATTLKHPSGCARIVHVYSKGWGWFATFLIILLCLFGVYLLAGASYRYFSLGVRGIDILPNLDYWTSLPQQAQSVSASLLHKFRGSPQVQRSSYSPVNF